MAPFIILCFNSIINPFHNSLLIFNFLKCDSIQNTLKTLHQRLQQRSLRILQLDLFLWLGCKNVVEYNETLSTLKMLKLPAFHMVSHDVIVRKNTSQIINILEAMYSLRFIEYNWFEYWHECILFTYISMSVHFVT